MTTGQIQSGAVIAIPAASRIFACKVIWLSNRSRDVMGMVVLPGVFDSVADVRINDGPYQRFTVMGQSATVIYCDKKNVTKRKIWPVIGQLAVTDADLDLLVQQVGASLYQGDQLLRNIGPEEQGKYPKFLVAGNAAVEGFLQQLLVP